MKEFANGLKEINQIQQSHQLLTTILKTTAYLWCHDYSISISACEVCGANIKIQVSKREFHIHVHLDYVSVEFLTYIYIYIYIYILKKKNEVSCQRFPNSHGTNQLFDEGLELLFSCIRIKNKVIAWNKK